MGLRPWWLLPALAVCGIAAEEAHPVRPLVLGSEPVEVSGEEGLKAKVAQQPDGIVLVTVHGRTSDPEAPARQLTWADTIERLRAESPALRELLSDVLARLPLDAYFWECPPVSRRSAGDRLFSFVALPALELQAVEAEEEPFFRHLAPLQGLPAAKTFSSLGGDSWLVAPAKAADDLDAYAHIGNFFRRAPAAQHHAQWRELAGALGRWLEGAEEEEVVWVSTEGSGVHWLHMRLDPRPKYYHYPPFTDPRYGLTRAKL